MAARNDCGSTCGHVFFFSFICFLFFSFITFKGLGCSTFALKDSRYSF
jgi:hypothetical protein